MNAEKRKAKRKKKRRIRWMRLLVSVVIAAAGSWYFFSGGKIPDVPFLKSFEPVRLYAIDTVGNSAETAIRDKGLAVYDAGVLTFYDLDGVSVWEKTFEAENPRVFADENHIVFADAEKGKLWRMDYGGETVNSLEKDFPLGGIYQNRASYLLYFGQEGNQLDVIDNKGKTITEITVPKGYILDAAISDNSSIVAVSTLSIENEKYYSSILFYNLDGTVMAGNRYDGEIIFRAFFTGMDELKALANDGVFSMSRDGDVEWEKKIEGNLSRADINDSGYIAMVFEKEDGKQAYLGIDENGEFTDETEIEEEASIVSLSGRHGAVFTNKAVRIFDMKGRLEGVIESDFEIEGGGWLGDDRIMLVYENRMEIMDIY
ncbi:MAG: hypothetical protein C0604_09015 [Clostridiales bacterium]|nr:MAG: hypothetical protein C0604_09015 [Clostridiales bacterium]